MRFLVLNENAIFCLTPLYLIQDFYFSILRFWKLLVGCSTKQWVKHSILELLSISQVFVLSVFFQTISEYIATICIFQMFRRAFRVPHSSINAEQF